jgi:hypothetical protein
MFRLMTESPEDKGKGSKKVKKEPKKLTKKQREEELLKQEVRKYLQGGSSHFTTPFLV